MGHPKPSQSQLLSRNQHHNKADVGSSIATNPLDGYEEVRKISEAVDGECDYVNVPVRLTADDLKNLRRIFEGKYEPLEKATLVVRVKRNKP